MKKKIYVTVIATFGVALIALGLAPAVKSISQSLRQITQAEQFSDGAGQKKAGEEIVDTLYLPSETAEPVVEQTMHDAESDDTEMALFASLLPEWITAEYGPGDSYYHVEVADGDPEVVFNSFSEEVSDFIKVVSSDAPDDSLRDLSTSGEYELHLLLGHESEETLENVGLSTTFCWLTPTRLRFATEITYGAGSTVVYAEEFAVTSDDIDCGHSCTVGALGFVNITAPSQNQALLTSRVFSRNLFSHNPFKAENPGEVRIGEISLDNALLPGGAENLYEITIPFGFIPIPSEFDTARTVEVTPGADPAEK